MRTVMALVFLGAAAGAAMAQDTPPAGEQTFRIVCASCHSLNPPVNKAPPMTHVARHYRQAFGDEAAFVDAVVQWVKAPEAARSKLPAHAIERFGLMPAFPLPDEQLREVARYLWRLSEPAPPT